MYITRFDRINTRIWPGRYLSSVCVSDGDGDGISTTVVANTIYTDKDSLDGVAIYSDDGDPLRLPDLYRLIKEIKAPRLETVLITRGSDHMALDDLIGAGYVENIVFMVDSKPSRETAKCMETARLNKCRFVTVIELVPESVDADMVVDIAKMSAGAERITLRVLDPSKDGRMAKKKQFRKTEIKAMAESIKGLAKAVRVVGIS